MAGDFDSLPHEGSDFFDQGDRPGTLALRAFVHEAAR
jgi:hypothetical protein